jgi:hypothetical protein
MSATLTAKWEAQQADLIEMQKAALTTTSLPQPLQPLQIPSFRDGKVTAFLEKRERLVGTYSEPYPGDDIFIFVSTFPGSIKALLKPFLHATFIAVVTAYPHFADLLRSRTFHPYPPNTPDAYLADFRCFLGCLSFNFVDEV